MHLYLLLCPLLVAAAYCDLRYMKIPNLISLVLVAAFLIGAAVQPMPDLAFRLIAAATVLVVGFGAFALRLFGGGDVKLLAALMLYVPATGFGPFAYLFSAAMLAGMGFVLLARLIPRTGESTWKFLSGKREFPMGISIALSGLALPLVAPF